MTASALASGSVYRASRLEKNYGGVAALKGVDFEVRSGEVHAIVGANGAGKSTLMKILAGVERPSEGTLDLDGGVVSFSNAIDADRAGIAMVSQEFALFPTLDVLHNLFIPSEPTRFGVLARQQMRRQARVVLETVGLQVPLDREVGELRLGDQQLLEIARAIRRRPKILILDEPTSALNAPETQRLLAVTRDLRASGVGIVFVSHFLEDVLQVADVITVVRDGLIVSSRVPREQTDVARTVTAMLGQPQTPRLDEHIVAAPADSDLGGAPRASVSLSGVSLGTRLREVSLTAAAGEIVGIAGLEGAGVAELFGVLFGRRRSNRGTVRMHDGKSAPRSIPEAVRRGIAFVPADRRKLGLITGKSVWENVGLVAITRAGRGPRLIHPAEIRRRAAARGQSVNLAMSSVSTPVDHLSGGNQQKVVFAKWLEGKPGLLLLDDPTRGVDVQARADMHEIIRQAAGSGLITLFYSSDLEEYSMLCNRVLVFYRGQIVAEVSGSGMNEHSLLTLVSSPNAASSVA